MMTPRTLAMLPQDDGIDLTSTRSAWSSALSRYGRVDLVGRERAGSHSPQWFHERESRNDFVVYAADAGDTPGPGSACARRMSSCSPRALPATSARLEQRAVAGRQHAPRGVAAAA